MVRVTERILTVNGIYNGLNRRWWGKRKGECCGELAAGSKVGV
jgi:hypothetical protein